MAPLRAGLRPYAEVVRYLDSFTNYERDTDFRAGPKSLGLGRILRLLSRVSNPHQSYDTIHIAGTKGKGSTAALAAAVLGARGLRVGIYTSPHLVCVRERIAVNGVPIGKRAFCRAFRAIEPALQAARADARWLPPTYFETLTAMAFVAFCNARVDVAIVEVGLGGRLDATNVVRPVVAGITPVSIDHVRQLGNTLASIAREKAGIIKRATPVIVAPQRPAAMRILERVAAERRAPVRVVGCDGLQVTCRTDPPPRHDEPERLDLRTWRSAHRDVPLALLGRHQVDNAAEAAGLVEAYFERVGRAPLRTDELRRAWASLPLRARVQVVDKQPWTLIDGAHNPASVQALIDTLKERFDLTRLVVVFAAARDKDVQGMARLIGPCAWEAIATETGHPRTCPASELAALLRETRTRCVSVCSSPEEALIRAQGQTGPTGLVCATGSLYLAGRLLAFLDQGKRTRRKRQRPMPSSMSKAGP